MSRVRRCSVVVLVIIRRRSRFHRDHCIASIHGHALAERGSWPSSWATSFGIGVPRRRADLTEHVESAIAARLAASCPYQMAILGQRGRWPSPETRTDRAIADVSGGLRRERREAEYGVLLGRSRDGFVGRVGFDLPVGGGDGH